MLEIKSFYKEYEDMFEEYIENIKSVLKNENEKYKELQKEYYKILDENENLVWIIEGQTEDRCLSTKECTALSKLVKIYYDMQEIEEKEIFFLGGKEAYCYLKNIRIIN